MEAESAVSASLSLLSNSAKNLPEVLQALQDAIAIAKADVFETVRSNYSQFSDTFRTANDMEERVSAVYSELRQVLKATSSKELIRVIKDHERVSLELQNAKQIVEVLRVLSALHSRLIESEKQMSEGAFLAASRSIATMQRLVGKLPRNTREVDEGSELENEKSDLRLFKIARLQVRKRRVALRCRLEELLSDAVSFSDGQIRIQTEISSCPGRPRLVVPIPLHHLFAAFWRVEMHENVLKEVIENLSKHLLKPLFEGEGNFSSSVWVKKRDNAGFLLLQLEKGGAGGAEKKKKKTPFPMLLELFQFLKSEIIGSEASMMHLVGRGVLKEVEPFVTLWMKHMLPSRCRELCATQTFLREETKKFIDDLSRLGFGPSNEKRSEAEPVNDENDNNDSNRGSVERSGVQVRPGEAEKRMPSREENEELSWFDFIDNLEVHFANEKRKTILQSTRDFIFTQAKTGKTIFVSEREGSVRKVISDTKVSAEKMEDGTKNYNDLTNCFRFPKCRVSEGSVEIVKLAYSTLEEACSDCSPYSAGMLFRAARDIFDVWRATCPVILADSLHIPGVALVYHNDCMYFAHHAMYIGHQFRDRLPMELQPLATFVDLCPPFRALGERRLCDLLREEKRNISDSYSQIVSALTRQDSGNGRMKAEQSMRAIALRITRFAAASRDTLPKGVFERSVLHLGGIAAEGAVQSILGLGMISPRQAQEAKTLFGLLLNLGERIKNDMGLQMSCNEWEMLEQITAVISEPFGYVREAYEEGRLAKVGGKRVCLLVSALFPPSVECQKFLEKLE